MKWTIDNINHSTYQVLGLQQDEVKVLQALLKSELPKLQKKFDKIRDIQESGEATEKQQDAYFQLEMEVETLQAFLKQ